MFKSFQMYDLLKKQAIHKMSSELYLVEVQNSRKELSIGIEDLEKKKKKIQNIQILQPPSATILPVKQIKTKRNVLLASVVGLFLMLCVAFFLEYINKYKTREKREEG